MPMIQLTTPAGVLDDTARKGLQNSLAATLLKWEGAPDNAVFRALAWCRVDEVPGDRFAALEDDLPRFRVDVTVPQGALSARRKEGLVKEVTEQVLATTGLTDADALRVWVLVHEQPEGTWGGGGTIVRFEDIKALAQSTPSR
ncbi:Phenylpyruvate tautomerase PptA, 4-oxalocrotonate tautomerase family [Mycolicibacterium rutilum]|uniref:Phenylpyruvate tautomerase PptA, 4-oxalocrotonate tautomerase family n=1 Tax=Mycolicibacterium rutilum TaxID=370526 RepID=A0A1H6J063_MYCRU|nr:tautomerase family protein [Mycolicibacterium rutilum]SEH53939.1 Phenylpyruvate tautomerase PptA, 4-oxalocrotonate tautomerase family [Mycolicibacterium rutilum]